MGRRLAATVPNSVGWVNGVDNISWRWEGKWAKASYIENPARCHCQAVGNHVVLTASQDNMMAWGLAARLDMFRLLACSQGTRLSALQSRVQCAPGPRTSEGGCSLIEERLLRPDVSIAWPITAGLALHTQTLFSRHSLALRLPYQRFLILAAPTFLYIIMKCANRPCAGPAFLPCVCPRRTAEDLPEGPVLVAEHGAVVLRRGAVSATYVLQALLLGPPHREPLPADRVLGPWADDAAEVVRGVRKHLRGGDP